MKQRNSEYIAIGANVNELQLVQNEDNFVKKRDSIFTICDDKSTIKRNMVVNLKTILEFFWSLCRKGSAVIIVRW